MSAERRPPRRGAQPETTDQLRMRRAVVLSAPPESDDRGRDAEIPAPWEETRPEGRQGPGRSRDEGDVPQRRGSNKPLFAAAAVAGAVLVALPLALGDNDNKDEFDYESSGRESGSPQATSPNFTLEVPTPQQTESTGQHTGTGKASSTPTSPAHAEPEPKTSPSVSVSPPKSYQGPGIRAPRASQEPAPTGHGTKSSRDGGQQTEPPVDPSRVQVAAATPEKASRSGHTPGDTARADLPKDSGTPAPQVPQTRAPEPAKPVVMALSTRTENPPSAPDSQPDQTLAASTTAQDPSRAQDPAATQGQPAAQTQSAVQGVPDQQTQVATAARTTTTEGTAPEGAAPAAEQGEGAATAEGSTVVQATRVLGLGESIESDRARLTLQDDGNLVVADENGTVRWSSHTTGMGHKAVFQADGHLVVYTQDDRTAWSSGTAGHDGAELVLQEDGDVVIQKDDVVLWLSGTAH
ncbi:hypothetical protein GCM10010377_69280 [Streptomyces viridiviolaceus]|uniref:Bulb-type lectin domain-containing protein n=1 Tax=Streptomyces viridiviolaceus TaxID=68282 RepID=A0ABW2DUQ3_9ACTN|nr:hypothetical protein [Streptomyces viridiviolaceus]GHB68564.1 hypothetical protein GCM10010377_69280 [Streptomyces viridiviolaceus]